MQIQKPKGWRPAGWRSIPEGAFEVHFTYGPRSMAECRAIAKHVNRQWMGSDKRLWMIVAATDGRLAKGGAA